MSFKIGFAVENENKNVAVNTENNGNKAQNINTVTPRKSLVKVYFNNRNLTCTYYNDLFDLKVGDMVYVDGKLEGLQGKVVDVCYNFKIKLSDYKKVTHLIDNKVTGDLYLAGSHMIAFDRGMIPFSKVMSWFKTPDNDDEEYEYSNDDASFNLADLSGMNIASITAEKGHEYYLDNCVRYIEIDGNKGKAIVSGNEVYTVEFSYNNGEIKNLICDCYCTGACKHEFAAMLQLKETLKFIENNHMNYFNDYLAVIDKSTLFNTAVNNAEKLTLG